jgi:hypothetical protein
MKLKAEATVSLFTSRFRSDDHATACASAKQFPCFQSNPIKTLPNGEHRSFHFRSTDSMTS